MKTINFKTKPEIKTLDFELTIYTDDEGYSRWHVYDIENDESWFSSSFTDEQGQLDYLYCEVFVEFPDFKQHINFNYTIKYKSKTTNRWRNLSYSTSSKELAERYIKVNPERDLRMFTKVLF
jgi:hypothetical protein